MYKVKISQTGFGYRVVLYKKFLFIWWPDWVVNTKYDYPHLAIETIVDWQQRFNIPDERIFGTINLSK